jgi:hypothetical protein
MVPNQTTDATADVEPTVKKQTRKTPSSARKTSSNRSPTTRRATKRGTRAHFVRSSSHSDSTTRLFGNAKSAFDDAYSWAGNSTKKMSIAARKSGLPREFARDTSLILAAVGIGVSLAVGAVIMGYGSFEGRRSSTNTKSSRKRTRAKT